MRRGAANHKMGMTLYGILLFPLLRLFEVFKTFLDSADLELYLVSQHTALFHRPYKKAGRMWRKYKE
jgi:hypothetical protein